MKSLALKLAKVMQEVKYIQKKGKNSFHNYNYATEADVNEKIREELSKLSVALIPSVRSHAVREITTKKGNIEYITTVDMDFVLVDAESGETLNFSMSGSGQDPGDKGIYKAISGCQKYALMKLFMIPTGDDPEADSGVDERTSGVKPSDKKMVTENKSLEQCLPQLENPITQKQVGLIKLNVEKLVGLGISKKDSFQLMQLEVGSFKTLEELTSEQAERAIKQLDNLVAQNQKQGA